MLKDDEAKMLSRTKVLCVMVTVGFTLVLVTNGASVGAMMSGVSSALFFLQAV